MCYMVKLCRLQGILVGDQEGCLEEETLWGVLEGWVRRRAMGDTESLRWAERGGKELSAQQKSRLRGEREP